MIKKIFFIISIFILYSNCSFDTKSGIWTNSEKIEKITEVKETILFKKKNYDIKEFNKELLIEIPLDVSKNNNKYQTNNFGVLFVREDLSKKSKYKYSKIKYFDNFNPELIFDKDSLIFFDKKGSIIKFDDKSKIIWKKNFYTKREKKLLPILKFTSNNNQLIVTDSFAKYYAMDLNTGEKLWEKNHKVVFISDPFQLSPIDHLLALVQARELNVIIHQYCSNTGRREQQPILGLAGCGCLQQSCLKNNLFL